MPRAKGAGAGEGDPANPATALERTERWAGLRRGDVVRVEGTRMRGAHWTFLAHVRNARSGEEWVEVVGGRGGDRTVRSFPPSQVFAPTRGPSLAEAPRLPL